MFNCRALEEPAKRGNNSPALLVTKDFITLSKISFVTLDFYSLIAQSIASLE